METIDSTGEVARHRLGLLYIGMMLSVHAAMLAWGATRHSHTWDELGHLAAGVSVWRFGSFELYRVNPPLVRTVATALVSDRHLDVEWDTFYADPVGRPEFALGDYLLEKNGMGAEHALMIARVTCIPFSLLAAAMCYIWARDLFGRLPGCAAATLWCFCPNVLGHGQLITPDVGATAFGLLAGYAFWRWLMSPTWTLCFFAGVALALAELTKTTWIVFFALWPALWAIWTTGRERRATAGQLCVILALGVLLLNVGYGMQGSFRTLGSYSFVSTTLKGNTEAAMGNRFKDTPLRFLPLPFPEDYVLGIDCQKRDFDGKMPSFLMGEWRKGGWLYYYAVCVATKVPLGTLLLGGLALVLGVTRRGYAVAWRDEAVLLAPAVTVFVFVSLQTGFNHHCRYVLPCFPFAFIAISRVFRSLSFRHYLTLGVATVALGWSVVSSVLVFPHSLSYFNEVVGGPENGHWYLGNSNSDWGQDLLYLKDWLKQHPEAGRVGLAFDGFGDPRRLGIDYDQAEAEPLPGWFVVGVNRLHSYNGKFDFFQRFEPVDRIGYSMNVYHVTKKDANRVRRELSLPELP